MSLRIVNIDPQGEVALSLLREAAAEVRPLYSGSSDSGSSDSAPPGSNSPLGPRDVYVAAMLNDVAVACGSIRELDGSRGEIRRMYVQQAYRRKRVGHAVLLHLVAAAARLGFERLCLETGNKQPAATALYESFGFTRIAPFGDHVGDPTSICYELWLDKRRTM